MRLCVHGGDDRRHEQNPEADRNRGAQPKRKETAVRAWLRPSIDHVSNPAA
jgi:hypothetical protein